jgi:hypothetical protein
MVDMESEKKTNTKTMRMIFFFSAVHDSKRPTSTLIPARRVPMPTHLFSLANRVAIPIQFQFDNQLVHRGCVFDQD